MKITSKELYDCEICGYLKGFVEEQFNGRVTVFCPCMLNEGMKQNPAMIAFPDGKLRWKPISDFKDGNGDYWHVPHFAGPTCFPPINPRKK